MNENSDRYTAALRIDDRETERYYAASLGVKTEQQKRLEELLRNRALRPARIADIACGGGTASHHLSSMFPDAGYTLVDLNEAAMRPARKATEHLRATCVIEKRYLPLAARIEQFRSGHLLANAVVARPGGEGCARVGSGFAARAAGCTPSSLFNADHDVDVCATVRDHTRASALQWTDLYLQYLCDLHPAPLGRWARERF